MFGTFFDFSVVGFCDSASPHGIICVHQTITKVAID